MKQLILIRHGKSNWDAPSADKDRTLAARGIRDAAIMATALVPTLPGTYTVWSSTAVRAASTMRIFAGNTGFGPADIVLKNELYTFELRALEKTISGCAEDINCLLVFGHNEAITDFVNKHGDKAIENVPTCGIVSIAFDTSWKALRHGATKMMLFQMIYDK